MSDWSIESVSEDSLLITWSQFNVTTNSNFSAKLSALTHFLLDQHRDLIINVIPAYTTVLIQFDIVKTNENEVVELVTKALSQDFTPESNTSSLHQIPVFYDRSVAADIEGVCADKEISVNRLIELHTSSIYDVFAVGFMPGFAYLGYIPEQLASPRHHSFRGSVPSGSVAIADQQTAIYPAESPGGWQIIGRTPSQMLNNYKSVLQTGDRVQFYSIDRDKFLTLGGVV